jgi:hypothetical protein
VANRQKTRPVLNDRRARIEIKTGGKIEKNADGQEVFVIPAKEPVPVKLEQSRQPGPIVDSENAKPRGNAQNKLWSLSYSAAH